MELGDHPIEGLKSELAQLRLFLCNAESTLTKAEERIDKVDVLEAQIVTLTSQLRDQNKHGDLRLQESTNTTKAWGSEDSQDPNRDPSSGMPRTSMGVTDRVSGFMDDKKQTQCHKEVAALDTRALYEKVEMLQNQNDELRQRIGALEAENKRQMGNSVNKYQIELGDNKIDTKSLVDEKKTKNAREGLVSKHALTATPLENGNELPLESSVIAKQYSEYEKLYHEETNARLKAIERALRTSEVNLNNRDWMSLKKQQYLPYLNKELPSVKLVYGQPKRRTAQAVLVMRGDSYALGASVLASRVKSLGTQSDVVCMVTLDVSENVRECMSQVFDAIYEVPYLQFSCERMTTKKQQTYYESWIAQSFTKWNVLGLSAYDKVLLVDADLLPLHSLDSLFELRVPAATFSSPWANSCKEDGYVDPYVGLEHGSEVPGSMIQQAVMESLAHSEGGKGSYVALGSLVLLEPSQDTYFALIGFVSSRQPFGVPGLHSGFDEQSLILFFNTHYPHRPWTHISQVWNSLAWHERWLGGAEPKAYHYFNEKPWSMSPAKYPDLKIWYSGASDCLKRYPGVEPLFKRCLGNQKYLTEYEEMIAAGDRSAQTASRWEGEGSRQSETGANSPHWGSTSPSMLESRPSWADIQDEVVENARASSSWTDSRRNSQDPPPRSRYSSPAWDDSSSVKNYKRETPQATPHHLRPGNSSAKWSSGRNPDRWARPHESASGRVGTPVGSQKSGFYGNHWQKSSEPSRRAPTPDNWRSSGTRDSGTDYRSKRFSSAHHSERW